MPTSDKKISQMTAVSVLTTGDKFPLVQSGVNKVGTIRNVFDLFMTGQGTLRGVNSDFSISGDALVTGSLIVYKNANLGQNKNSTVTTYGTIYESGNTYHTGDFNLTAGTFRASGDSRLGLNSSSSNFISGRSVFAGNIELIGGMTQSGAATIYGNFAAFGNLSFGNGAGSCHFANPINCFNSLNVEDIATFQYGIESYDIANFYSNINVSGNFVCLGTNNYIGGGLSSNNYLNANTFIYGRTNLNSITTINSDLYTSGNLSASGSNIKLNKDTNGKVTVAGTLFANKFINAGDLINAGSLSVTGDGGVTGSLTVYNGFKAVGDSQILGSVTLGKDSDLNTITVVGDTYTQRHTVTSGNATVLGDLHVTGYIDNPYDKWAIFDAFPLTATIVTGAGNVATVTGLPSNAHHVKVGDTAIIVSSVAQLAGKQTVTATGTNFFRFVTSTTPVAQDAVSNVKSYFRLKASKGINTMTYNGVGDYTIGFSAPIFPDAYFLTEVHTRRQGVGVGFNPAPQTILGFTANTDEWSNAWKRITLVTAENGSDINGSQLPFNPINASGIQFRAWRPYR